MHVSVELCALLGMSYARLCINLYICMLRKVSTISLNCEKHVFVEIESYRRNSKVLHRHAYKILRLYEAVINNRTRKL